MFSKFIQFVTYNNTFFEGYIHKVIENGEKVAKISAINSKYSKNDFYKLLLCTEYAA